MIKKPEPHWSGAKAPELEKHLIPRHVAIVMDGNGRWARNKGLARTEGHKAGEEPLFDMVQGAIEVGVKELSAYAFSTENWKRSPEEVRFLMGFNKDVLRRRRDQMNELGVRIRWIGQEKKLWSSVISELEEAEELTAKNKVLTLNMCVNYGGRAEIVTAAEAMARDFKRGKVSKFDEKTFAKYLELPSEVDLFLRSSGEQRLSNFLPWQSAYAEFVFMDVLWPDADRRTLWSAIQEYASRNRRFGKA